MMTFRVWVGCVVALLMTTPAMASERMAVNAEVANVRADPGKTGDILWKMERYFPVIVIEKEGPWYRFKDLDGQQGWVHGSLLDSIPTVVIRVRLANIRNGPGTRYDVVFDAEKGTPFKVLQRKGSWIEVQHSDGDRGWIFKSLVW